MVHVTYVEKAQINREIYLRLNYSKANKSF
jgi:hypothetical protein